MAPVKIPRRGGSLKSIPNPVSLYTSSLGLFPLATKTATNLVLMALSFFTGRLIAPSDAVKATRLRDSPFALLLLLPGLYFPITSHYYYGWINGAIPGSGLIATLKKSMVGQLSYGPVYTSVFFLSQLIPTAPAEMNVMQALFYSLKNSLLPKMRSDFFPVWRSGVFYWMSVDLISFSVLSTQYISPFVSFASFLWSVYLSIMSRA